MINFYTQEVGFVLKNKRILKNWLKSIISEHNLKCGDINVIFCSDPYLLDINRQYLNHDYFTDIITFNFCEGKIVSGELYISIDTVKINAQSYDQIFENELYRVIVHGVLHLIGYDDITPKDSEKMTNAENLALSKLVF